ncbi:MAG TPA: S1/P1 Nuclease, partial [Algoriphagus sp.]|nr:S1/P1 Nuclease [Algoriphagus sp.]
MKKSIKAIADFWYTAWINAGQPDLKSLPSIDVEEEEINPDLKLRVREH